MLAASVSVHMSFAHGDLEGLVFLVSSIPSDLHSSVGFPEPCGEGFDGDIPFRALILCIVSGRGSLCLFPSAAGGSL